MVWPQNGEWDGDAGRWCHVQIHFSVVLLSTNVHVTLSNNVPHHLVPRCISVVLLNDKSHCASCVHALCHACVHSRARLCELCVCV